jgi:hypothetical protein
LWGRILDSDAFVNTTLTSAELSRPYLRRTDGTKGVLGALSRAAFEILGDCGGLQGGNEEALLLDFVLRCDGIVPA